MSLPGSNDRQHERSYAPYQADREGGYAGQILDARCGQDRVGELHIREQTQAERDIIEDGIEGGRPLENEARRLSAVGGPDLHEAVMMSRNNRHGWVTAVIILAVILIGNLGGLWFIGAI
mgnify:CR=1 FL=1